MRPQVLFLLRDNKYTFMEKYRIVTKEHRVKWGWSEISVLADNLTLEDANYNLDVFKDQGRTNLEIQKYLLNSNRLGRDPDLH